MGIPFTQYMRPDGRPVEREVTRPDDIEFLAEKIIASGRRFECEVLSTGDVSLTVTDDEGGDLDIEVVRNEPGLVLGAVDSLVTRFAKTIGEHA